ncbi:MAG: hypothetical protein AB7V48_10190 [Sedimentibacter sp.]
MVINKSSQQRQLESLLGEMDSKDLIIITITAKGINKKSQIIERSSSLALFSQAAPKGALFVFTFLFFPSKWVNILFHT